MSEIELVLLGCLAAVVCLIEMNYYFRAVADLSTDRGEQLRYGEQKAK